MYGVSKKSTVSFKYALMSFVYNLFNSLAGWNSLGFIKFIHSLLWQKAAMLVSFISEPRPVNVLLQNGNSTNQSQQV